MVVAITGASGFIGSFIAATMKRSGHSVRSLVRPSSRRDHIAANVDEWVEGDQADAQSQAALVAGVDAVVHNAADWQALEQSPQRNLERNLFASLSLLEQAQVAGVGQFIFISSGAVYHEILQDRPLDENHPTWPAGIYGAYKAAIEPFLKAYHFTYGMNTSSWRPVAVYGIDPNIEKSQWFDLVKTAKAGGKISTAHGGKITHVQDIADAVTYALGDESVSGRFHNLVDCYMYWQVAAELAKEISGSIAEIENRKGTGPKNQYSTRTTIDFFNRHNNSIALRRGVEGVREYVRELLPRI